MCMGLDGGIQSMQYRACEDGCLKMAMRQGIILVNDVLVRRSGVVLCRTIVYPTCSKDPSHMHHTYCMQVAY